MQQRVMGKVQAPKTGELEHSLRHPSDLAAGFSEKNSGSGQMV